MADERPYQINSTVSVRPIQRGKAAAPKELPPLSEAEHARIKRTIAYAKANCPEVLEMVKNMHADGLIDGWRSLTIEGVQ